MFSVDHLKPNTNRHIVVQSEPMHNTTQCEFVRSNTETTAASPALSPTAAVAMVEAAGGRGRGRCVVIVQTASGGELRRGMSGPPVCGRRSLVFVAFVCPE